METFIAPQYIDRQKALKSAHALSNRDHRTYLVFETASGNCIVWSARCCEVSPMNMLSSMKLIAVYTDND